MSLEVVHARANFREHRSLRFPQGQRQLDAGRAIVTTTAELPGELGRIHLVAAPDAYLGQVRPRLFEEDGELLAADRVELVDGAVRLVGRGAAVPERGLADRAPDQPAVELVVRALQAPSLHSK